MTSAISVAGLTRRYRGQLALDDVTLDLEPGSITGLLGRNGAGKTTFLRIIAGHEFASAGTVAVLGAYPVENETVLRQIVFVREDQAYPDFRVRQVVQRADAWHSVARFFTTLTIEGLTGLLAALTVALLAGGYASVRRLTV